MKSQNLEKDCEDHLNEILEHYTLAAAEMQRWIMLCADIEDHIKEGMEILDVEKITGDLHTFKIANGKFFVTVNSKVFH
tara:strand:- start:79 stop:315 length:237 start_codon:yes stop_codon:yes gene_type:complete